MPLGETTSRGNFAGGCPAGGDVRDARVCASRVLRIGMWRHWRVAGTGTRTGPAASAPNAERHTNVQRRDLICPSCPSLVISACGDRMEALRSFSERVLEARRSSSLLADQHVVTSSPPWLAPADTTIGLGESARDTRRLPTMYKPLSYLPGTFEVLWHPLYIGAAARDATPPVLSSHDEGDIRWSAGRGQY